MRCRSCGSEMDLGERFCGECGALYQADVKPAVGAPVFHHQDQVPPAPEFRPPPPDFGPPQPASGRQPTGTSTPKRPANSAGSSKPRRSTGRAVMSCMGMAFTLLMVGIGIPLLSRVVLPWAGGLLSTFTSGMISSPVERPYPQTPEAGSSTQAAVPPVGVIPPPTLEGAGLSTEVSARPMVSYRGVSFNYDPRLASEIGTIVAPAGPEVSYGGSPEHILFTLEGYPVTGTDYKPEIRVFPVREYEADNETAAETIADLQSLLAQTPDQIPGEFPFLPVMNAGQLILARAAYSGFQNGFGLRYLTQLGQSASPINNRGLIYTFQGLTNDGAYYVAATFPITHPNLPADGSQIPGGDYTAFEQQFDGYVQNVTRMLNDSQPGHFTPDTDLLAALIQSLSVNPQ